MTLPKGTEYMCMAFMKFEKFIFPIFGPPKNNHCITTLSSQLYFSIRLEVGLSSFESLFRTNKISILVHTFFTLIEK